MGRDGRSSGTARRSGVWFRLARAMTTRGPEARGSRGGRYCSHHSAQCETSAIAIILQVHGMAPALARRSRTRRKYFTVMRWTQPQLPMDSPTLPAPSRTALNRIQNRDASAPCPPRSTHSVHLRVSFPLSLFIPASRVPTLMSYMLLRDAATSAAAGGAPGARALLGLGLCRRSLGFKHLVDEHAPEFDDERRSLGVQHGRQLLHHRCLGARVRNARAAWVLSHGNNVAAQSCHCRVKRSG